MRITHLFCLVSIAAPQLAQAHLFDLIGINEGGNSYLWSIGQSASSAEDAIYVRTCPRDEWIERVEQCQAPTELMTLTQFKTLARETALNWAVRRPETDLKPLTAAQLAGLKSSINPTALIAERDQVDSDLKKVEKMLTHLPNSVDYQASRDRYRKRLEEINAILAPMAGIDKAINDLSEELIRLMRNNDAQGKFNTYARSQMEGTFLHEVMNATLPKSSRMKSTSPLGFPAGFYHTPNGTVYRFDGKGHACGYTNWKDYQKAAGDQVGIWTEIDALPPFIKYTGACR